MTDFSWMDWNIRSLPVMGFFPFGGNLRIPATQLSSFAFGPSVDLLNLNFEDGNFSLLNASAYLLGVNYSALSNPESNTQVLNLGYLRIGPHYRFEGFWKNKLSMGAELGYAALLLGSTEEGTTKYLHGLDVSLTFSWTEYEPPTKAKTEPMSTETKLIIGGVGMIVLSAATCYWGSTITESVKNPFTGEVKEEMSMEGGLLIGLSTSLLGLPGIVLMIVGLTND